MDIDPASLQFELLRLRDSGITELYLDVSSDERGTDEGARRENIEEALAHLAETVRSCENCPLSGVRKQPVFGEGNSNAVLMFVGEGPGEEEDRQGRPFVGAAGQLLDKIIQAMGLDRSEVYIANIVKCHPPGNRNPGDTEIACCLPYLKEQIRFIKPEVIVALGSVAARALLDTDQRISRLRGAFHLMDGVPVMPTFHPAYLDRKSVV